MLLGTVKFSQTIGRAQVGSHADEERALLLAVKAANRDNVLTSAEIASIAQAGAEASASLLFEANPALTSVTVQGDVDVYDKANQGGMHWYDYRIASSSGWSAPPGVSPPPPGGAAAPAFAASYLVQSGDTVWAIAEKLLKSAGLSPSPQQIQSAVDVVAKANSFGLRPFNPSQIVAGVTVLSIPERVVFGV